MKNSIQYLALVVAALSITTSAAQGQGVFLNAGESYIYRFDGLAPHVHYSTPGEPYAHFDLMIHPATDLAPDGALQIEFFDDEVVGSAFFTRTLTSSSSDTQIVLNNVWDDVQGAIRFSMLASSLELERMILVIGVTAPGGEFDTFGGRIPIAAVPEPGTVALIALGGTMGILACSGRPPRRTTIHR